MPRIKRKDIYPLADPVFGDDYVIGSRGESFSDPGKTQNFSMLAIAAYVIEQLGDNIPEGSQDNIGDYIDIYFSGNNTYAEVVAAINTSPQFEVSVYNDMWFRVVNLKEVGAPEAFWFRLINVGKGIYGAGGSTLTTNNIQLVCAVGLEIEDFNGLPTTDTFSYGAITTNLETWINSQDPAIVIQSQGDGYTIFTGTIDGVQRDYLWIGLGGTYGVGESTALSTDLQLLTTQGAVPSAVIPTIQQVLTAGNVASNLSMVFFSALYQHALNSQSDQITETATGKYTRHDHETFFFGTGTIGNYLRLRATTSTGLRTQMFQDRDGVVAIQNYKSAMLYVLQSGTSAPTVTVISSEFSSPIVPSRYSTGLYYLDCADFTTVQTEKITVTPQTGINAGPTGFAQLYADIANTPQNRIRLQTRRVTAFNNAGTLTDTSLPVQFIGIRIYN